jgi:hypothetical protein
MRILENIEWENHKIILLNIEFINKKKL